MGSRSDFGGRGTSVLLLASLFAGVTTACDVYKRDLLKQTAAGGPAAAMAGTSGKAGPAGEAGNGEAMDPMAPAFDAAYCTAGECWWSRGGVDDCRSAGVPMP